MLEPVLAKAGQAVADRAVRGAELKDLIRSSFRDQVAAPRKFGNQVDGLSCGACSSAAALSSIWWPSPAAVACSSSSWNAARSAMRNCCVAGTKCSSTDRLRLLSPANVRMGP
ncbi:hypothetical protein ACIBG7_21670 [Nonomuraea sp. NPDC050328]|uniref:hypothetical protein n=1 Tax=Nonomuraea sp. NPDC050328 TaxID=3364361 RepID=UPI00379031EC